VGQHWSEKSDHFPTNQPSGTGSHQSPIACCPAVRRMNRCSSVSRSPLCSHFLTPASSICTYQRTASSVIAGPGRESTCSVYPVRRSRERETPGVERRGRSRWPASRSPSNWQTTHPSTRHAFGRRSDLAARRHDSARTWEASCRSARSPLSRPPLRYTALRGCPRKIDLAALETANQLCDLLARGQPADAQL
jgi:hypothetical protein